MREHRQIYKATLPGNVPGCVVVGVRTMPAGDTQKLGLGFPVALVDMPAFSASSAGVTWIDNRNGNSGSLGFVLDKVSKLAEAPVVQSVALLFSGLDLRTDMRQIFESNTQAGAFSSGNDCFGNTVVLVLLKPLLLAAHLAKAALCCSGACTLQCCSAFGVSLPVRFNLRAGVLVAHAVGGNADDSEIHTKHTIRGKQLGVVEVTNSREIPLAAHEHQVNFALSVFEKFALVIAASAGDFLAPGHKPDRHNIIRTKAKDAVIVWLCGMFAESALCLLVNLVRIRDLGNATYSYLSRYLKLGAKFVVTKFVQIVLPENLGFPSLTRKPITGFVAALKRSLQHLLLLFGWLQFEVGYQFHVVKYRGV